MNNSLVVTLTVNDLKAIVREAVKEEVAKAVPPPPDKLNTPIEAAKRLRCSPPTLANYRDQGLIEETRIGKRKVFYKDSAIEAALITIKKYKKLSIT